MLTKMLHLFVEHVYWLLYKFIHCIFKQSTRWNHDKFQCECKELNDYIRYPCACHWECGKASKFDEYLDIESWLCKKCLFAKLILTCEDEILNIMETSFVDKRVTCEKDNCLIYTVSWIIICLLLLLLLLYYLLLLLCKTFGIKGICIIVLI